MLFSFWLICSVWQILSSFKFFRYACSVTECCIQTVLGRLRELLILDWDFGLQASSRDPNSASRDLFWFGLRIVGILQHSTYELVSLSRIFGARFDEKDRGLCTYKP